MLIEYYYEKFKYPIIFTGMIIDIVQPLVFISSLIYTENHLKQVYTNENYRCEDRAGIVFSHLNIVLVILQGSSDVIEWILSILWPKLIEVKEAWFKK